MRHGGRFLLALDLKKILLGAKFDSYLRITLFLTHRPDGLIE
jgi:hypothetical protein